MTVKELKNAIRWANIRISEAYEKIGKKKKANKTDKMLAEKKVAIMQHKYGAGRNLTLKLGFRGKRKRELETQLSEFESFADFLESTGKRTRQRKASQTHTAYTSFKDNYGMKNLKYSDYKELVTIFGAVGRKIVDQFGSDNIIELYNTADKEERADFLNNMLDVLNDSKGQGWTMEELYDEMLYRIETQRELRTKKPIGGKK